MSGALASVLPHGLNHCSNWRIAPKAVRIGHLRATAVDNAHRSDGCN